MPGHAASEWTGAATVVAGALALALPALIWWRWGDPDRDDRITRVTSRCQDSFPSSMPR